jgi:hypothetical protein
MQKTDYNIALFVFFIPYILFEVPSNLILKKLAPSTWLSAIMVLWGMSTFNCQAHDCLTSLQVSVQSVWAW